MRKKPDFKNCSKKKFYKNLPLILLAVVGLFLLVYFLMVNFIWKKPPQTPLTTSSLNQLSVSAISSSTVKSSTISKDEIAYPNDTLSTIEGREEYKDGEIVLQSSTPPSSKPVSSKPTSSTAVLAITNEAVPQSSTPAKPKTVVLTPCAAGTLETSNGGASIDASNLSEGYVMVKYDGSAQKLKLQITGTDSVVYTYNLCPNFGYETFPLTSGNGSYKVNIYENVQGTQYALVHGETFDVNISNSLKPYLYPNQYVNFNSASKTVAKSEALAMEAVNEIEVVQKIYNYVITNIKYDDNKASTVKSGYLPVVDDILASGKGICFDYAAVLATMLRSQNIPARLEIGYASGNIYHAWISVHLTDIGWVNGIIQFDGTTWKLMDPTFASNANSSKSIMQFIGNSSNYNTKYVY